MKQTKTMKERIAEFADEGYTITVTGRHVHVTDAMKSYAIEKLPKIERVGNRIIEINLTMDIQKLEHKVDITMKYGHTLIRSHAASNDMYVSIDMAIDKLQKQLKKYKRKLFDHHAKEHPVIDIPVTIYSAELDQIDEVEANNAIEKENEKKLSEEFSPHKIVSSEKQQLKILTDDEAVMKMELSGAQCMVYRSEESKKLTVIYRREDGNYGVVKPE